MKQRVLKTLLIGFVAAAVVLAMSACEGTITIQFRQIAPTGQVTDAKTGQGIGGATLTLTYVEGLPSGETPPSASTTTTGSDGSYTFGEVPYATYKLSATKTGYVFIERIVSMTNATGELPLMLGFAYDTKDANTISIVTTWSSAFDDVDAHITFPSGYKGQDVLDSPNDLSVNATPGFLPDDSGREHVYWDTPTSTKTIDDLWTDGDTRSAIELDVDDVDGSGPETVSVRVIPFDWSSVSTYSTSPDTENRLPSGNNYAWIGTAEFYVHGYSASLVDEGSLDASDLEVFVFQGDEAKGLFTLPDYTAINAASLFRINFLVRDDGYEVFQIVPEMAIYNQFVPGTVASVRSIEGQDVLTLIGERR